MGSWVYGSTDFISALVEKECSASVLLYCLKIFRYIFYRRLDGPQRRSGCCRDVKNVDLTGNRILTA
jgi:hypothetical protein